MFCKLRAQYIEIIHSKKKKKNQNCAKVTLGEVACMYL